MSQQSFEEIDWLKRHSLYSPDRSAIVDVHTNREFSYGEFFRIANYFAATLAEKGISEGDRVAVLAHNRVETVFLFYALQRLGAILVPVNFRLSTGEVDYILSDSGAKLLIFGSEMSEVVKGLESAAPQVPISWFEDQVEEGRASTEFIRMRGDLNSPVKILYTSGTTGFPKGVVITHKILFWNSVNTSMSLNVSSEDCMVSFLPLFHTGGWNVLLTPFIHRGAKTVFLPQFDAEEVLEQSDLHRATLLFGVPTTLGMMAKAESFSKVNLSSVRYAVVGGEPMPLPLIQQWHEKGVFVRQGFGLTECGPNCFSLSEKDAESRIGSIGRPNFYVDTMIVDEENHEVNPGEVGELLLRGPMCMTQYWGQPEATEKSFFGKWLRTGDLVKRDEENYFYVVGRKKEMFISGGENVYPAEVEKVLSQIDAVDEVAVIGTKDDKWGEVGKAFIVIKPGQTLTPEEVSEFCSSRLAKFKIPKHIEWKEELPKGATGKILKKQLVELS